MPVRPNATGLPSPRKMNAHASKLYIAEQPQWERLRHPLVLPNLGMTATLRCAYHDAYFDDATACAQCLLEDEA